MNEMSPRFQELWEQCKSTGVHPEFGKYVAWNKQKFAELIVRECLSLGDVLSKHYMNTHSARDQAMLLASIADYTNEIKKHFGVAE
jgi:hypothetical protein